MNLFYRSLVSTALALLVFDFGEDGRRRVTDCTEWDDGRPTTAARSNHPRNKRVYEGTEVKSGEFPYVVFLKSIIHQTEMCEERLCTGTLIHPRFLLTTRYCVEGDETNVPKVLVFLIKRPYGEAFTNLTYRSVDDVVYENDMGNREIGLVALARLNATFESVKQVASFWRFEPIHQPEQLVDCHTVGFSLIGRTDLKTPPDESLMPMEYVLKAKVDVHKCTVNSKRWQHSYLCDVEPDVSNEKAKSLCEGGDEGGPLLCKATPYQKEDEQRVEASTYKPPIERADYYVYGLANNVAKKVDCHDPKNRQNVLFVYTVRSGVWISVQLESFDLNNTKHDQDDYVTTETSSEPTTPDDGGYTGSTLITRLPDYYDTDDYDAMRKKPMRRCKGGGRVNQDVRGSSFVVHNRVVVEDVHQSSSSARDPPTRGPPTCVAVAVFCVYHYYFYRHYCNTVFSPLTTHRYTITL